VAEGYQGLMKAEIRGFVESQFFSKFYAL